MNNLNENTFKEAIIGLTLQAAIVLALLASYAVIFTISFKYL